MLLGRDTELGLAREVIDRARDGHGGAFVLHGEAGVGKSALLAAVADATDGFTVLRTQGIESEAPLAFAALHRLLLPLLDRLDELPEPQAKALRGVFGLAEWSGSATGNERFLVFLAALGLLVGAAEEVPVLCVIDDAHWLDDASAAALLFIARRVQVEPVAMLFGARDGDARRFDPGELPGRRLAGLDDESAEKLLLAHANAVVPASVREQLLRRAEGNPLALVEIPAALSAPQLEGEALLPAHLPLTDGIERVFLDRYDRVPAEGRMYLVIAAADDSGDTHVVDGAARHLGTGDEGRELAEQSGLLQVSGGALRMRHPLVRSAIYAAASRVERRRAHAALAEVLGAHGDHDRAAWHQAAGLDHPDEATAALLESIASRSQAGGGHESASAAWERASELSARQEDAARRLYAAAAAAWMAGQPDRSRTLAQMARPRAEEPILVADIDKLRAIAEMNFGSARVSHGILLRAARDVAPVDPGRAREMAMIATALVVFGADSGIAIHPLTLVPPVADEDNAHDVCFGALLTAMQRLVEGDLASGTAEFRRALAAAEGLRFPDLLTNIPIAAVQVGDDSAALRWHDIELDEARQNASPFHILHALTRRSLPDLVTGRWTDLASAASEALNLAEATSQPNQKTFPLAALLLLSAFRGEDGFDRDLREVERHAIDHPAGILDAGIQDVLAWARAVHLAPANADEALHHLTRISHPQNARAAVLDRLETAARAGRRDIVQAATDDIAAYAAGTGAAWAAAAAEHGRALLAEGGEAERHFLSALEHHDRGMRPFNRARTALALGEFLRRARRRVDSREHLRSALVTFEELGARPWAERARDELRASGESSRRREDRAANPLTPQEQQVARLVQQGLPNRDVAARLFVSPRTVDFHLRNVFTKLGISSRGGLLQVDLDAV
ncbi:helix-turn-helix transcriptional regulator [Cryobacterium tepidiphilum]|uniref:Helix-turn-helix transcriptional regulator n=1 Tax=Cryobacterium tepidiphilum TaxID=2486026 RepID=A0A3M8LMN3_9MICO|nr:helix-turn-helix transcriptional regulator [Cryobacterium tepidiphilum]RNE66783.1 helix-turn-helix transcriptional regulator [Cryobacterium tepidiphilum]